MKILIVKTSAIGDVIQTFPALEYLRKRFPKAKIDWVVEKQCAPLIEAHPLVDQTLVIDTKKWKRSKANIFQNIKKFLKTLRQEQYDLLFDLQGNSKSGLITLLAKAKVKVGFGLYSVTEILNLISTRKKYNVPNTINVRLRYLKIVQDYFNDTTPFVPSVINLKITDAEKQYIDTLVKGIESPIYMVCFGSKWRNKQLEEKTLFLYLQKVYEAARPYFLFIYGGNEEEKIAERLEVFFEGKGKKIGNLSLPLWQALMNRVDLVIAMDSAALHLCGTTKTRSFSIFGPSKSNIYKPLGEQHIALQGVCPYNRHFIHRCPVLRSCSTGACIRSLNPEQIIASMSKDVE